MKTWTCIACDRVTEAEKNPWCDGLHGQRHRSMPMNVKPVEPRTHEQFAAQTFAAEYGEASDALVLALDALDEVMSYDKGMGEEDWVEFCNRLLPFMQRQGRQKHTVGWS